MRGSTFLRPFNHKNRFQCIAAEAWENMTAVLSKTSTKMGTARDYGRVGEGLMGRTANHLPEAVGGFDHVLRPHQQ